ncbi:ATP-dependent DNA helicase Q4 [Empidonax traillii]|uniref:ATP-dependent DNA helicase Q4 n=1 Tax=Empidonax traillii TaxID=164674 RepID=UPI000FFD9385|nr:ATP-dependent DNA helicase Q4 [Empidonax traillii]
MSAQFYGMKLKSKLGTTGKEPPLTPHRTPNPRRIPAIPRFRTQPEPTGGEEESGNSRDCGDDPGDPGDSGTLLLPPSLSGLPPLILNSAVKPPLPPAPQKFQRLKERVAQTLGSLDPAWLQRCQEIPRKDEIPTWKRPGGNVGGDGDAPKKLQRHHRDLDEGKFGMKRNREEEEEGEAPKESGKTSGNVLERLENTLECLENTLERLENTLEEGEEHKQKQGGAPKESRKKQDCLENRLEKQQEDKEKQVEAPKKRRKIPKRLENILEEQREEQEKHMEAPKKRRKTSKCLENLLEKKEEHKEKQVGAPEGSRKTPERLENLWEEEEEEQEKPKPPRKPRSAPRSGGNFVRLNLRRKSYTRFSLRGKSLRKQVWREKWRKKSERFGGGRSGVCFRCGNAGHWAAQCPGSFPAENDPKEEEEEDPLPTLEEVARRTNSIFPGISSEGTGQGWREEIPMLTLDTRRPEFTPDPFPAPVEPLYSLGTDGAVPDPPEEVLEALRELGYASFRPGQAVAVMRILCGLSTLVVLPTGLGKSLCYQLPALLYRRHRRALTLVVSPLVSLMDDQVSGLPPCLRAVCVHSNMSKAQREKVLEKVRAGEAQVLLVSPEALVGGTGSGSGFLGGRDRLPPVAFACLDEAHCVSQWAHNFRPSYLRICKVLRDRLGIRCFLGLTATATPATARDVARHLGIPAGEEAPARLAAVPPNLLLSVSMERDRDEALVSLLGGERFGALDSIIVYCTRREETERVAALIRTRLQGIPAPECATTAPGTRGKGDLPELRRHIYGDTVEFWAIKQLVLEVFAPCKCRQIYGRERGDSQAGEEVEDAEMAELLEEESEEKPEKAGTRPLGRVCHGHERCLPIQRSVESLDLREEGIETLLCYLELHPQRWLELLLPTYSRCRIRCSGGPRQLRDLARSCPPVGVFLARERLAGREHRNSGTVELEVMELSDSMGWEAALVKRQLRQIQWDPRQRTGIHRDRGKSGIQVEFEELSFHFRSYGDLSGAELDSICSFLLRRVQSREKAALGQLRTCFRAFQSVAFPTIHPHPPEGEREQRSSRLKDLIQEYFERDPLGAQEGHEEQEQEEEEQEQEEEFGSSRVKHQQRLRSLRNSGSPRFPAQLYGRDRRFWRKHLRLDFQGLARLATQELLTTM